MLVRSDKKLTLTSRCIFAFREEPRENALIFFGQCLSSRLAQIKSMTLGTSRPDILPRPRAHGLPLSYTWEAHGPSTALCREPVASASLLRAALLLVGAAPALLVMGPTSFPIRVPGVAVIRLGRRLRAALLLIV